MSSRLAEHALFAAVCIIARGFCKLPAMYFFILELQNVRSFFIRWKFKSHICPHILKHWSFFKVISFHKYLPKFRTYWIWLKKATKVFRIRGKVHWSACSTAEWSLLLLISAKSCDCAVFKVLYERLFACYCWTGYENSWRKWRSIWYICSKTFFCSKARHDHRIFGDICLNFGHYAVVMKKDLWKVCVVFVCKCAHSMWYINTCLSLCIFGR